MTDRFDPTAHPHRRFNPLSGEWVMVSPQRMKRPWQGRVEAAAPEDLPRFDPACYLCPGNERAGGEKTPKYEETFVFDNDFAALLPEAPEPLGSESALLRNEGVRGECRVICFSPRHDLTLAKMSDEERRRVVRLWAQQTRELGGRWKWVQVFENRGEQMGASNPHPHGQVWALDRLPTQVAREDEMQRSYSNEHRRRLLLDYATLELELGERVIAASEQWLAVVPYWAVWPFETLLLPLFPVSRLDELGEEQQASLASILGRLLSRYDNLFQTPFPYSMGWHGAPFDPGRSANGGAASEVPVTADSESGTGSSAHWQLHAHFYPPLLRSATVRKFMVGFELLGEAQRDLTPEQAAEHLRATAEASRP